MNTSPDETSQVGTELSEPDQNNASQGETTQSGAGPGGPVQVGADPGGPVQGSTGQSADKPATPVGGIGPAAIITAIALIAVYIAMLFYLMTLRSDAEWDRLVYLLSGFEALVFAGAGALFGTTIQRANVTSARNDASDAKKDAADAKKTAQSESDRAQKAEKDAAAGRFLAAAVNAKADTRASNGTGQALVGSEWVRGSHPETDRETAGTGTASRDADLAELCALARTIMPD